MNKVLLTGRLTRDPEMRSLASGKNVTTFSEADLPTLGAPHLLLGAGLANEEFASHDSEHSPSGELPYTSKLTKGKKVRGWVTFQFPKAVSKGAFTFADSIIEFTIT